MCVSDLLFTAGIQFMPWIYYVSPKAPKGIPYKSQLLLPHKQFFRHFLDFGLLLRHLTVWFYLSDVKTGEQSWEARPPVLSYPPEPQERVYEKAQRINLQLLQLIRHTLLYLFNHTSLWTIEKIYIAEHMYAHTQCPLDPIIKQTVTSLVLKYVYIQYVCVSLHLLEKL